MEVVVERYDAGRTKLAAEAVQVAAIDRGLALARYDLAVARRSSPCRSWPCTNSSPCSSSTSSWPPGASASWSTRSSSSAESASRAPAWWRGSTGSVPVSPDSRQAARRAPAGRRLVTQAAREKQTIAATLSQREAALGHAQAKVKRLVSQMQTARLRAAAREAAAAEASTSRAALTAPKTATRSPGSPRPSSSPSALQPVRPSPAQSSRPRSLRTDRRRKPSCPPAAQAGTIRASRASARACGGSDDRPALPGRAVRLGRRQPCWLRLLGACDVRVREARRLAAAQRRHAVRGLHPGSPEIPHGGRSGVLRLLTGHDPPRRHLRGQRRHDRRPLHGCRRAL